MKTKQPTAKLPKARVEKNYYLVARSDLRTNILHEYFDAVLPAATKAQARQMVKAHKFLAMTREEQAEAIKKAFNDVWASGSYDADARAVLALLYGEAKP
jgi:hypothetical protein